MGLLVLFCYARDAMGSQGRPQSPQQPITVCEMRRELTAR